MPNTAQSDIAYQPSQKGFSYSNPTPETPKPEEKKPNVLPALFLETLALLILFFIFLGVLNYFNLVSLNRISPTVFGWLPHLAKTTTQSNSNKNAQTLTPSPTSSPDEIASKAIKGKQLTNEASLNNIASYIEQMIQKFPNPIPVTTTDPTDLKASGIFSGYNDNYFQIIGANKLATNFYFDSTTAFNSLDSATVSANLPPNTLVVLPTSSKDFLNPANYGKYLQIDYTSTISGYLKALIVSF
jgi:cytoskeletal protein RodZ